MKDESKYLKLARKIYELVKRGEPGERDAAKHQLNQIMEKHGITLYEIEGEEVQEWRVKCKKDDWKFLVQIIANVCGSAPIAWQQNYGYIDCTAAEITEIEAKFKFYKMKLAEHMEAAYIAFIQTNELYRKQEGKNDPRDLSEVEKKAIDLMKGMRPEEFHKQITG